MPCHDMTLLWNLDWMYYSGGRTRNRRCMQVLRSSGRVGVKDAKSAAEDDSFIYKISLASLSES
jgi:hypothetical protein